MALIPDPRPLLLLALAWTLAFIVATGLAILTAAALACFAVVIVVMMVAVLIRFAWLLVAGYCAGIAHGIRRLNR